MLVEKTKDAAHTLGETRITIAGGVSANKGLQQALEAMCQEEGFTYYKPHKIFVYGQCGHDWLSSLLYGASLVNLAI